MQDISIIELPPEMVDEAGDQREIVIPEGQNFLLVELADHSWVAVFQDEKTLVREDSWDTSISFFLAPGSYQVITDGKIKKLTAKSEKTAPLLMDTLQSGNLTQLHMTSDAPDQHIVDGVGEIAADGQSYCTVSIEKTNIEGKELNAKKHKDEIFLRTTGGLILDADGNDRIRSINLESGKASFRLVSDHSPRVITVTAFTKNPMLVPAELQIEFV